MPDLPSPHEEWVYNPANIDAAPVIWALDLGQTENEELRRYYAGRSFWRVKPAESTSLSPYQRVLAVRFDYIKKMSSS